MPLFRRRKTEGVPFDQSHGDPRATRLVQAVEADDLDGIRGVLTGEASVADLERFTHLVSEVEGHPEIFDAWVERAPDEPMAWLARGAYGVGWAWAARGGGYAETVSEEQWELFFERLNRAESDLMRAAEMDPQDPLPWSHMLVSGRGLQVPTEELRMRLDEVQSRRPWLVEAHMQLLQSLCAKWFGSDEESLEFARATSREAPEGAAVHALVPMAHIEIWLDMERREGEDPAEYEERSDVREEIQEAARRSVFSDAFADELPSVFAMNVFAMGLHLWGDPEGALALVRRLGRRRTEFPWVFLYADPGVVYGELLAEAEG